MSSNAINPISAGTDIALEGKSEIVQNSNKKPAEGKVIDKKEYIIESVFNKEAVEETVDEINARLVKNDKHLEYSFHDKTNTLVVKIIDTSSGEIVKEIPNTKLLEMAASVWERFGLIIDEKA